MRRNRLLALMLMLLLTGAALAQSKISIPAGTPEDKELTAISNENDAPKRVELYEQFVSKYASNPAAVAYGNWQLAQQLRANGDSAKALEYGDKALAAMPEVLDIVTMQADIAQQARKSAQAFDYAIRGAAIIAGIDKQAKPGEISDEDWQNRIKEETAAAQQTHDYLETVAYNAIQDEKDKKVVIAEIEKFNAAFPKSRYADAVAARGIETIQASKDLAALGAFGDKVLAANPNSVPTLVTLAYALAEDGSPAQVAKAAGYSRKAIELAKLTEESSKDEKILAGLAHYSLGLAMLKEDKATASIPEFKTATTLLKDDAQQRAIALFRLGYAYAKLNRAAEAKQALNDCIAIEGPLQAPARELLSKVGTGAPAARKRR